MLKKLKKFFTVITSFIVMTSITLSTTTVYAATTKSYNFNNMTYKSAWGVTYSISNGSANLTFSKQYNEIKFNLPETLDMSQCKSVIFNASSSNGPIAFKLYDTSGNQAAVRYNFQSSTSNCTFSPNTTSKVNCIGIMSQGTNSYSAKINSVKFTMKNSTPDTTTDTLLNTYGSLLKYSGAAVNSNQLNNSTTLNVIKKQYNSITMENEMKPDAVLGHSPRLISVSQAKSNGYYIPSNYNESTVPSLNFNTIDAVLRICNNNGLKLRAHTLVWHSQTPDWFFRTGYSSSGSYVSQSVMNARMEMFIKTYMNHIYNGNYGSVVYAWDVVNEYLHAKSSGGWSKIYGSNLGTRPAYVKKAFQYAYDSLDHFGLTNSVSLFYNDYNTYLESDDIVSLINYINSGTKLCDGVGMQSHLSTSYPSVSTYKSTMQKFMNAGLEIQVTELDVTNSSANAQADYIYNLLSAVISLKKAGAKITGLTWWGLYDSVSWRASKNPLLFSSLTTPKDSYYKALQAYRDAGY